MSLTKELDAVWCVKCSCQRHLHTTHVNFTVSFQVKKPKMKVSEAF